MKFEEIYSVLYKKRRLRKMKKLTVIILLFLVIINISYSVFGDEYALGVTDADLATARENETWADFYNRFVSAPDSKDLSDVDLIRMIQGPTEDELVEEHSSIDDISWVQGEAKEWANTRAKGGEQDKKEWEKLRKEAVKKNNEILEEKDADKLKELKKEYIEIVEDMMKKDATATTEDSVIYGPYNTYTADLNKENHLYEDSVGSDGKTPEQKADEKKDNKIYKQPSIKTGTIKKDGTLQDMISDGDKFLTAGNENTIEADSLKDLSGRIYNILLEIGVGLSVIIGIILGIKFMLSGVEEKAEVKKMVWVYVVGCVVTFGSFGIWKLVVSILEQI